MSTDDVSNLKKKQMHAFARAHPDVADSKEGLNLALAVNRQDGQFGIISLLSPSRFAELGQETLAEIRCQNLKNSS